MHPALRCYSRHQGLFCAVALAATGHKSQAVCQWRRMQGVHCSTEAKGMAGAHPVAEVPIVIGANRSVW